LSVSSLGSRLGNQTLLRCFSNRSSVVVFIPRNWLNIGTKEKYAFINLVDFIEDFLTR